MSEVSKWFVLAGCVLIALGGAIWLASKVGIPLGHFPGDIRVSKENFSFYFPIVTSIVVSIILTIVINVILSIMRK